jgi:hypothetical protein
MIININSWPGVGKLTIAEELIRQIGGCLLDNHTIYNVAFSLCEFHTPPFYETVRAVRAIAFERAAALPSGVPLTLTSAYADTPFGRENWAAIRAMADKRGSLLCVVVLDCSMAENTRRLQSPERASRRKLVDPGPLTQARRTSDLLEAGGDYLLRFDVSDLSPQDSANRIAVWLREKALVGPHNQE